MSARRASWQACGTMRSSREAWPCILRVQACEEADAALRKKLGRRLRKIDRKMDHGFQEALARLRAVCTELDGARRPIDWDG